MNKMAEKKFDDVDFNFDPALEEVLAALARPAEDCANRSENVTASVIDLSEAVEGIRAIGIAELLVADDLGCPASAVLFSVAERLANANVTVAWRALAAVPVCVALTDWLQQDASTDWIVALPSGMQWVQFQPLGHVSEKVDVCWFDGLRVLASEGHIPPVAASSLLGFPHGQLFSMPAPSSTDPQWHSLSYASRVQFAALSQALLSGLLHGSLRRLVNDAYGYAKNRRSAGKPISQHQAVALRLADLALHHEALSLYLQNRFSGSGEEAGFEVVNIDYVGETAARISRDAVQIAGAHGYVDGLSFKRLFEQVRTLTSALQFWQGVALLERNPPQCLKIEENT